MFGFHAWDLLIVLLIALIIFGPRKLPEIGGAVGKSIREFKKATNEIAEQVKAPEPRQVSSPPPASTATPELQQAVSTPATNVVTSEAPAHEGE
jgi:sec-independent protein translocase protein TatA